MYAVVRAGGRQYKVTVGEKIHVEKLDKELGAEFDISEVLFVGGEKAFFGEPTVKNAKVTVVVTQQGKEAKVLVFKKKRRKNYRRLKGHRQNFTELFVKAITSPDGMTVQAQTKPQVVKPKTAETIEKRSVIAKQKRVAAKKAGGTVAPKKAAAPKKKTAKKTAKKGAAKKTAAKKKTAKKG